MRLDSSTPPCDLGGGGVERNTFVPLGAHHSRYMTALTVARQCGVVI